jgi:transposase
MKCADVAKIVGIIKASASRLNQIYQKKGHSGIPDKAREGASTKTY